MSESVRNTPLSPQPPPPREPSYYEALGVHPDATADAIRAAFKKQVMETHPDRGGDEALFRTVQQAYEILCDPRKRRIYDQYGHEGLEENVETLFARDFRDGSFGPNKVDVEYHNPEMTALRKENEALKRQLMIVKPEEAKGAADSFESWLRNRPQGAIKTVTSADLLNELGGASYDPVPLPNLKSTTARFQDLGPLGTTTHLHELEETLPDALRWNEVLVHMLAAPVTPIDHHLANWGFIPGEDVPAHPFVAGSQGVGVVLKLGPGVEGLELFDLVLPSEPAAGTWRRLGVFRAAKLVRFPTTALDPVQIAHFFSHLNAFCMLEDYGSLLPGDVVIQNQANAPIGQAVIQLCNVLQIKTINLVAAEDDAQFEEEVDRLSALGATHVWRDRGDIDARLQRANLPQPRLAIDGVGGTSLHRMCSTLRPDSAAVCYAASNPNVEPFPYVAVLYEGTALHGFWLYKWLRERPDGFSEAAQRLLPLLESGKLKVETRIERFGQTDLQAAVREQPVALTWVFGSLNEAKQALDDEITAPTNASDSD